MCRTNYATSLSYWFESAASASLATSRKWIKNVNTSTKKTLPHPVFRNEDKNNPLQAHISTVTVYVACLSLISCVCCRLLSRILSWKLLQIWPSTVPLWITASCQDEAWHVNNARQEKVVAVNCQAQYFILNCESVCVCVCVWVLWGRGQLTHVIMLDWDSRHQRATEWERQNDYMSHCPPCLLCTGKHCSWSHKNVFGTFMEKLHTVSPVRSIWLRSLRNRKQKVFPI